MSKHTEYHLEGLGWRYDCYDLDTPSSQFPDHEAFIDLWREKKQDRFLPAWSDFSFEDFAPWWGSISVVDFSDDPFDCYYRLWGTKLVTLYDRDFTNKYTSDLIKNNLLPEIELAYYTNVTENVLIGYNYGRIEWLGREYISANFIDLPLSDDGKTVTNCLSLKA